MPEMSGSTVFKFNYAIVSRIPEGFPERSRRIDPNGPRIDLVKARHQLDQYVETLRRLGISVLELPADEKYPDSVFVEDCAVVINGTALICKPGERSRHGELAIIRNTLRREVGLKIVEIDTESASLDGGDVVWTGKEIFVGLSSRTNEAGAQCVAKAFPEYPTTIFRLPKQKMHLKEYIGMAGGDIMVCSMSEGAKQVLKQIGELSTYRYSLVTVDEREDWAASVLCVNNTVLHQTFEEIPNSYPTFEDKFDQRSECAISEFSKANGTLSSLSILIGKVKHPKYFPSTLP